MDWVCNFVIHDGIHKHSHTVFCQDLKINLKPLPIILWSPLVVVSHMLMFSCLSSHNYPHKEEQKTLRVLSHCQRGGVLAGIWLLFHNPIEFEEEKKVYKTLDANDLTLTTLMVNRSESGKVTNTISIEAIVSRWLQIPGPSSQATTLMVAHSQTLVLSYLCSESPGCPLPFQHHCYCLGCP